jgi:hypothetical protein
MPALLIGTCEYCGQPVTGDQPAAYRIRGWELERKQGGANRVAGKERQADRVCHALCVERVLSRDKLGLRGQLELI